MSAHVLLDLLNELGKRDKMRGLPSILSLFRNEFNKDNNTHVTCRIYRGTYMSAHVLLDLLNELRRRDKMRGLLSILSLFRNEFNKFNNTRAHMLDIKITLTLLDN